MADATGAVVPGASIKVTNNGTGLLRAGSANERGELSIPYLPVGQYSITVESAGFKKTSIEQVVLQVDQTASIHVTLQPGEVREVIEVKEVASSLENPTAGHVMPVVAVFRDWSHRNEGLAQRSVSGSVSRWSSLTPPTSSPCFAADASPRSSTVRSTPTS